MIITYVSMFLGVVIGFALAGPLGGMAGTMLGGAMGMMVSGVTKATRRIPADAEFAHDERRLLCITKGQVATATFLRDAGSGRWLDVERCTLCEPAEPVTCQKRCLVMMRDTLPPRRNRVRADASTSSAV